MAGRTRGNGQGTLFRRKAGGAWIARWYDASGKRREKSTKSTDKALARRLLRDWTGQALLRKEGLIDPAQDHLTEHGQRLLLDHVADYIVHCTAIEQAARNISQKQSHLRRLVDTMAMGESARLNDLTPDALQQYLETLRMAGKSARTWNFARQCVLAFANWCAKQGRLDRHGLDRVPKLDEHRDRRLERRPLTEQELASLFAVAREHGRLVWYMAAALAGLRKGDLTSLEWRDVDLDHAVITITEGKAKRTEHIPIHPQLLTELKTLHTERLPMPTAKVFPAAVSDKARRADFEAAGIAHVDTAGRTADLHSLRATLATMLARAGVKPQVAQQIMRHADYKTTQKHYTQLSLADTAGAIDVLPPIGSPAPQQATGTLGGTPNSSPNSRDAEPCQSVQRPAHVASGSDWGRGGASAATAPRNANARSQKRLRASKRVKGLEPSTFSLGS